jgi:Mor family transcriptional regulator
MTKYVNAKHVLPEHLVKEIQKYVQGQHLYIPRSERQAWGTGTGIREELKLRNKEMFQMYKDGVGIAKLAEIFCLSEERVESIIYGMQTD